MPGPLFAATLEQSLDRGPSAGPWLVAILAGRGGRGLSAKTHRVLARVCGGMILSLGIAFLLGGIRSLA